jgi:hypothetical protein
MLKVPPLRYAIEVHKALSTLSSEEIANLLRGPHVELSFPSYLSGILRRVKSPLRGPHLGEKILKGPSGHRSIPLIPCLKKPLHINRNEQRVVIEHLLEMRNQPLRIDRIAVETSPQLVKDPSTRHRIKGGHNSLIKRRTRVDPRVAHQKQELLGWGKLRSSTEASILSVETIDELLRCAVKQISF